ncbi:MAG TPA: outer membrane beta-barrel protein [Gemmatimonadales bacterium]|nr:outer membrane beta-barrel protein [Gemmatimonadales bacterium]
MLPRYKLLLAALAALVALAIPSSAIAQEKLLVEGQAGVAVPTGTFGKYTVPGPTVGLRFGYRLNDRLVLRADGDFDFVDGDRLWAMSTAPRFQLWHYTAGVEANVNVPSVEPVSLAFDFGVGAARMETEQYRWLGETTPNRRFEKTYPAAAAGLKLRFRPSDDDRILAFVGAGARVAFAKTADTQDLANVFPSQLRPFDKAIVVPVMAGLTLKI